jgi:hypothetical protein
MKKQDEIQVDTTGSYRSPIPAGIDVRVSPFYNAKNPEKGLVFRTQLQLGVVLWAPKGGWRVLMLTPNQTKSDFEAEVGFVVLDGSDEETTDLYDNKKYHLALRQAVPLFIGSGVAEGSMEITTDDDSSASTPSTSVIDWRKAIEQAQGIVSSAIMTTTGFSIFFQKKSSVKVRLLGAVMLLTATNPRVGQSITAVTDTANEVVLRVTRNLNTTKVVESISALPQAIEETLSGTKRSLASLGLLASGALLATDGKKKRRYADYAGPGLLAVGSAALLLS